MSGDHLGFKAPPPMVSDHAVATRRRTVGEKSSTPVCTLIGAPLSSGLLGMDGAEAGPGAVRLAFDFLCSQFDTGELYEVESKRIFRMPERGEAWDDGGDVPIHPADLEASLARVSEAASDAWLRGSIPLVVGGDRWAAGASWRGVSSVLRSAETPFLVVLGPRLEMTARGSEFSGGLARWTLSQMIESKELDVDKIVWIGSSEYTPSSDVAFADRLGIQHRGVEQVRQQGLRASVVELLSGAERSTPVLLSVSLDAVDSQFAPGVPTLNWHGFTPREVMSVIDVLATYNIAGCDLVNIVPRLDLSSASARLVSLFILRIMDGATDSIGRS